MSKPVWKSGPPPSLGWWPASFDRVPTSYRWWNGSHWSLSADEGRSAQEAGRIAEWATDGSDFIEWSERPKSWPARSLT